MYSIRVLYHNCNSSMASEKATLFCYRHAATTGLTTCMAVNFIIRKIVFPTLLLYRDNVVVNLK